MLWVESLERVSYSIMQRSVTYPFMLLSRKHVGVKWARIMLLTITIYKYHE